RTAVAAIKEDKAIYASLVVKGKKKMKISRKLTGITPQKLTSGILYTTYDREYGFPFPVPHNVTIP
ncbi:MAG TPA: hypothetical protein VK861_06195, partial [Bacteroidales bacterium]|nr:hypothetical protein [Bacteroidales bacterium]